MSIINIPLNETEINSIKSILEEREHCHIQIDRSFNSIWFHDENFQTELRILFLGNIRLTISRVCFKNKRTGTMTEILHYLIKLCEIYGIKEIVAQSVQTKEMEQFCIKNRFNPNPGATFLIDDILIGDYILKLS